MPSSHRNQVLLTEEIQAKVAELAEVSKRSMSAMCSELIEYALDHGFSGFSGGNTGGLVLTDKQKRKLFKLLDAMD